MFPEHRELIAQLRQNDPHFKRLFDQHNELDHRIKNFEGSAKENLGKLKKEKLALKDDIYQVIKRKMGGDV